MTYPSRLEIVAEDLEFLRDEWMGDVKGPAIRRASAVLRRLVVEEDLLRAWRETGFPSEPMISAYSLDNILSNVALPLVHFATLPSAGVKGLSLQHVAFEEGVKEQFGIPIAERKSLPLSAYAKAACLVARGRLVSRRLLIKYVANRLGGAHFGFRGGKSTSSGTEIFRLLDQVGHSFAIRGDDLSDSRGLLVLQLQAIGQDLAMSDDLMRLVRRTA